MLMECLFSDKDMQTVAGHVNTMKVSAACEVFLIKLDGKIEREFDETTGLKLLKQVNCPFFARRSKP